MSQNSVDPRLRRQSIYLICGGVFAYVPGLRVTFHTGSGFFLFFFVAPRIFIIVHKFQKGSDPTREKGYDPSRDSWP